MFLYVYVFKLILFRVSVVTKGAGGVSCRRWTKRRRSIRIEVG